MYKNFKFYTALILFLLLYNCNKVVNSREDSKNSIGIEIPNTIYPDTSVVIANHTDFTKSHYPKRVATFKENPLDFGEIVFLGNSITEQGGNWDVRLNNFKVKNRGISGDTTDGVLVRLDEIIYFKPKQVFLLIGINDLFREDMTSRIVYDNILKIVRQIHDGSPKTKIYVQTILPTTTESIKDKIQSTNQMLDKSESNQPYKLISLHSYFATADDSMNMELSTDGVHLNENGYSLWVKIIKKLIDK